MRIRSTKPEFWRSERIATISWTARLVLKGLESYVDDNGVGKDDVALIVGDVFPRDMCASPRETVARVTEAICELFNAGFLWRYEAAGTRLLFISWWDELQRIDRPSKGRFPRPDGTMDFKESTIRECAASPPESVPTGTEEQGNRGTGEKDLAAQTPPNKRGKRIPNDWRPSESTKAWAREQFPNLNLNAQWEHFVDYWRGESGQKAQKLDWDLAFKNWLRNARAPTRAVNGSTTDQRVAAVQALKVVHSDRLELP